MTTKNSTSIQFVLRKNTLVEKCHYNHTPCEEIKGDDFDGALKNDYKGTLYINRSVNPPAFTFEGIIVGKCNEAPKQCQLKADPLPEELRRLSLKDSKLMAFLENPAQRNTSLNIHEGKISFFQSISFVLLVTIGTVAIAFILFKLYAKPRGHSSNASPGGNRNRPSSSQSVATVSTSNHSNSNQVSAERVRKQFADLNQKLATLERKTDENANHILRLEQKIISLSSPLIATTPPVAYHPLPAEAPRPPAPKLSVRVIKESVLRNDYKLISSFPHLFLSETNESRQGREESKTFAFEGDHATAQSRSQSEFIAIPCEGEFYLIPNILPNAADPGRTIKRHAHKNSIYRFGSGANLLDIVELAVVSQSGNNQFKLLRPGQLG
jgi:hypothetical protein